MVALFLFREAVKIEALMVFPNYLSKSLVEMLG